MRRECCLLLGLVFVAVCAAGCKDTVSPQEELGLRLPLYDDFEASHINTGLWDQQEMVREVVDGELRLGIRHDYRGDGWEWRSSDVHSYDVARETLDATVRVTRVENDGGLARVVIRLLVQAEEFGGTERNLYGFGVEITDMNDGNGLIAMPNVYGCANDDCSEWHDIPVTGGDWDGNTPVQMSQEYDIGVHYLSESEVMEVSFDGQTMSFDTSGLPDFDPSDLMTIDIRSDVGQIDASGDNGYVEARFDGIYADGELYDDFEDGELSPTLWYEDERVNEIRNGQFFFYQNRKNMGQSNSINLTDPTACVAIHAAVRVLEHEDTEGARSRIRLGGTFYNDGSDTEGIGGNTGDVYAEIGLSGERVVYHVLRCTSENCSTSDFLSLDTATGEPGNTTIGHVEIGEWHRLFLQFDGELFAFQLDARPPVFFDPIAAGASVVSSEANLPYFFIGTRVSANEGSSGRISAEIDNVRAGDFVVP